MLLLIFPLINIFGYFSDAYYRKLYSVATQESKKYKLQKNYLTVNSSNDVDWWPSIIAFDSLMKELPSNTIVAASEDGFIADDNMNMKVMDLSQLHDNDMIKKIPLVISIENTEPDIIWMPHTDYTRLRYEILTSKKIMSDYDYYPQLLNYGIAIKKSYPEYTKVIVYFENLYKTKLNVSLE